MFLLGLITIAVINVVNASPLAFFAMLFAGNVGFHLGFLELLPAALAIKFVGHNIISPLAKPDSLD